jgi:hypothetical protein
MPQRIFGHFLGKSKKRRKKTLLAMQWQGANIMMHGKSIRR